MQNADNLEIVIKSPFVIKTKLSYKASNILLTFQTNSAFLITSVVALTASFTLVKWLSTDTSKLLGSIRNLNLWL